MRLFSHFLILTLLNCALHAEEFKWETERLEGRDYVPLRQVAEFYGFPAELHPVKNQLALDSDSAQIHVTLNSREIEINGVKHWLAFPVYASGDKILVARLDLAKTLDPALRPELVPGLRPVKTVVLDAGHGGTDRGAVSNFGSEKNFALDVCLRARKLLWARGYEVKMTRATDVLIPLEDRPKVANEMPDSIFVSVHFNASSENGQATGFEVFSITPRGAPSTANDELTLRDIRNEPGNVIDVPSRVLATCVYHSILGNIPEGDRGIKNARFAVIRLATVPAILIEGGFLSARSDSSLVGSAAWRSKLAEAIVEGVDGYKNLAERKIRPRTVADYRRIAPGNVSLRELTEVSPKTDTKDASARN
jgi:N-acetylmuramoyl-L-alanine amidase